MLNDTTPFVALHQAYLRRLIVAALFTAVAAGCGQTLYAGHAGQRWLTILVVGIASASATMMLILDLLQRWSQIRQLRIVEDGAKAYGFTRTATRNDAANDLGRSSRH